MNYHLDIEDALNDIIFYVSNNLILTHTSNLTDFDVHECKNDIIIIVLTFIQSAVYHCL